MIIKKNELISVIMPAYNAEKTLSQAIESVLKQSYKYLELIIVDDCSNDQTLLLARKYEKQDKRVHVLSNQTNRGVSFTRHKAVKEATGKWLAFLDSDDVWMSDKIEKQIALQRKRNAKLTFTGSAFMNSEGDRINSQLHVPAEICYRQLLKQNLISNSSVLVNKAAYQKHEIIGDSMHEDFACWLKMLRDGETAYGIDEPLIIYRLSPNSKSGNKLKAAKMNWNTYRGIGLGIMTAGYYMIWYAVNGVKKYSNLKNV